MSVTTVTPNELLSAGMGFAIRLVVWLLPLRLALTDTTECSFAETVTLACGYFTLNPNHYPLN